MYENKPLRQEIFDKGLTGEVVIDTRKDRYLTFAQISGRSLGQRSEGGDEGHLPNTAPKPTLEF